MRRALIPLCVVLVAVAAVVVLGGPNLDAQGAYHDEIYQAPAAFTWIGQPCGPFCYYRVGGIATFSMPYSGALRSAVFGVYMRVTGDTWSLVKWRLSGLLLLGAGIGVLGAAAQRRLGGLPAAILVSLCVSDSLLLVLSRHDGASVPLGFLLRALLLGVWLRSFDREPGGAGLSTLAATAIGALAGLAAYDKLHALALVPAVAVLVAAEGRRGFWRRAIAASSGFVLGALPVFWVHLVHWKRTGTLFALQGRDLMPLAHEFQPVRRVLSLAGNGAAWMIHGIPTPERLIQTERVAYLTALGALLLSLLVDRPWSRSRSRATLLGAWLVIVLGLMLLPVPTNPSHWILATPFVYLALAAALRRRAGSEADGGGRARLTRRLLLVVACGWLATRCLMLAHVQGILWGGAASATLEPNYTLFARHAAAHHQDAPFAVGQWGIGNSLFCEGQGRPDWIFDAGRWSAADLGSWLERRREEHVFLVGIKARWLRAGWPETERLLAALRARTDWVESSDVGGLNAFPPMMVWRFDRAPPGGTDGS